MRLYLEYLEFDPNREDQGYSIGGELYFSLDDRFFPGENWYDMAYFDLKTWIPALLSFGMKHTDSCFFNFMDGSYAVRMDRTEDGTIFASCLYDGVPKLRQMKVDFRELIKSFLSCCRKYDRFLYEHGKEHCFFEEIKKLKTILDI